MTDSQPPVVGAGSPEPRPVKSLLAPPIVPPTVTRSGAEPTSDPFTWTPMPTVAAPAVPQPATSAASGQPTRAGIGPRFVIGAVVAATVLASGGTYLAVSAANGGDAATTSAPVLTSIVDPAVPAPSATAPAAPAAPAPSAAAPAAPAPVAPAPATGGASVVDIVKAVSPAVVTIVAEGVSQTDPITGMSAQGAASGSGVIFDANGLILTNHHVVAGDPSKLTVNLKDGRSFDATIYGIDTLTDLAILKVEQTGLPTAPIGNSSTIEVGQTAIAIGSPLGEFTDSVTSGIISAIGRDIPVETTMLTNLIQTDTAINPGNSGGPLLDPSGKVIGINTAVAGGSQGIGFAIPIDMARPLLAQASAGQPLARAWLGIQFQTIDPTLKSEAGLTVDAGAWIPSAVALSGQGATDPNAGVAPAQDAVVAGSPAAQAGLQPGDIITAVDGTALDATHPLDLVISEFVPDQTVTLTVLRDSQSLTISLTLGTRPATS